MADETLRVLIVDDSPEDTRIIRRLLTRSRPDGVQILVTDSTSGCVDRLQSDGADVVLLDYNLPEEDGLSFLRRLTGTVKLPPVIVLTGQGSERLAVEAMRCGAFDYVPKDQLTEVVLDETMRHAVASFEHDEALSDLDEQIMVALAAAAESRDFQKAGHLQRIARCSVILGQELGLSASQLQALRYGALLHDIGKLAVSDGTLRKPTPLTTEEQEELQQHVIVGERICSCLWCASQLMPVIRYHHERWDGSGYVEGLAGKEIPLTARIVGLVDAFDAMSSDGPHRRALPPDRVVDELRKGAGHQWDPSVADAFIRLLEREALDPSLYYSQPQARAA